MGVGVDGDGDAGVSQEVLDQLGVDATLEEERGAGVPEIVEGNVREPRAFEKRREGPLAEVRGIDEAVALSGTRFYTCPTRC